jgi:aspartate racemase
LKLYISRPIPAALIFVKALSRGKGMKTLGLIGGTSWESTAVYYRYLNEIARKHSGGLSSAKLLLWSFDFAPLAAMMVQANWDGVAAAQIDAARRLERAGAEALLICANTMHKVAPLVEKSVSIPLIHIADAAAEAMARAGCSKPLLLATRFVMEEEFYRARLSQGHGIEPVVPEKADRDFIHGLVFNELCLGIIRKESKSRFLSIVSAAVRRHSIDSVILGCTEFGLLANQPDFEIPCFDTASIHAEAAMAFARSEPVQAAT